MGLYRESPRAGLPWGPSAQSPLYGLSLRPQDPWPHAPRLRAPRRCRSRRALQGALGRTRMRVGRSSRRLPPALGPSCHPMLAWVPPMMSSRTTVQSWRAVGWRYPLSSSPFPCPPGCCILLGLVFHAGVSWYGACLAWPCHSMKV